MSDQYVVMKLEDETYAVELDKGEARNFDAVNEHIRHRNGKQNRVDHIMQVSPRRHAVGNHIVIVTHTIGLPGLRQVWALIPSAKFNQEHWSNYFKHTLASRADLTKLPERYISSDAKYIEIKHD